uniref:Uncharacterized protein n=1 Tax=Rhizophora mucronata TaxID=61149 RepID=A0A2P2QLA7_RHIMU
MEDYGIIILAFSRFVRKQKVKKQRK